MKLEEALKSNKFKDESHKAALNIMYTAYWYKTHLTAALKESGLTPEQFNVLRILKGKHPEQMCVKDIGSRMIEANSNVPRIVDRLVLKKLAKRAVSKEDRRETLISLTEKGVAEIDKARNLVENEPGLMTGLNEEEAKQLNDLLEKLRDI